MKLLISDVTTSAGCSPPRVGDIYRARNDVLKLILRDTGSVFVCLRFDERGQILSAVHCGAVALGSERHVGVAGNLTMEVKWLAPPAGLENRVDEA